MYNQGGGYEHALLFAVPNGELRHPVVAAQLSGISAKQRDLLSDDEYLRPFGQGVVPGAPDLILLTEPPNLIKRALVRFARWLTGLSFFAGQVTFIEMKVAPDQLRDLKGGTQSRGQRLFMLRARLLGHDYRVIDSQTAFWDLCAEKGVKLRVARPWALAQPSAVVRKTAPAKTARLAPVAQGMRVR